MAKKSLNNGWLSKYQTGGSYEVKKGDSFWNISEALNIPFEKLLAANPDIDDPNMIYIGQQINLPTGNAKPVTRPVVKVKQEQQQQPTLKFMPVSLPSNMIKGAVSESTSQPITTKNGVVMTGYKPEVKVSRPLSTQERQRIEQARAQIKAQELAKKIKEEPPHPGYPVDNTATQIYNPGVSYTVQDANGKSRVVQVEKPSLTSTASINAADPGYMAPKIMDWTDYAGMGIGALATALPLGIAALETAPVAFAGLESAMAMPLYSSAPAWATVGNALTAASIPATAQAISYLPQDIQSGNLSGFLHHGIEAGFGLLPFAHAASEAGYIDDAGRMLGTAAKKLSSSYESLKKDAEFIKLMATKPAKAAEYVYKNHRDLYNKLFDTVYDLKKFKENPMGFFFGKKLNTLTPELIQLAENTPKIPENVQKALNVSRDLHKLTIDAEFFKKEKDVERQLQSLKTIHDKMPVLSEEDFFRVTGVSKEAVVKQINRLEKQLGLEPSKLTYVDDPAKIVDLTPYESEFTFKKSKNPLDDIQPIYPVGYNPPTKDYIIESTYHGSRNAKSMGVQYGKRYEGEELSPTIIYDPAKPETDPRRVLIEGKRKFQNLGSGKRYINATSLSTDSKQMELRSIVNQLKQGTIKNVETEGLAYINDMGSTSKLPRRALVDEMNQYIDEMNVYLPANKKVPHAVLQKNGDIWAPHFTLTKKAYGGWLDKYQLAGTVMPADVLMDPAKLKQWMKDHPEATVANANKQVIKDPRAVNIDPRLLKNTPKVASKQETIDYPASDPRSQSYTGAPATTLLMNPNRIQGEGARIIEGGNDLAILSGLAGNVGYPYITALSPFVGSAEGALNLSAAYEGLDYAKKAYDDFGYGQYLDAAGNAGHAALGIVPGAYTIGSNIMKGASPFVKRATAMLAESLPQLSFADEKLNPYITELIGTFKKGRKEAIKEGNDFLTDWIKHPETQKKIDNIITAIEEERKHRIGTLTQYGMPTEEWSKYYDNLVQDLNRSKTYEGKVQEYPLYQQTLELLGFGKYSDPIHGDNNGVAYSGLESFLNPRKGKAFVSRDPSMSNYQRSLITTHEGTHQWLQPNIFTYKGNKSLDKTVLQNLKPEILDYYTNWKSLKDIGKSDAEIEKIMGQYPSYLGYLGSPPEVHARTMELRNIFNLKPGQIVTPEMAAEMRSDVLLNKGKAKYFKHKSFVTLFPDNFNLANVMNGLPVVAGAAAVPAVMYMNNKQSSGQEEQKYGGWLNKYK